MHVQSPSPVACGNHKVHGPGRSMHHHRNADEVRECFSRDSGLPTLESEYADENQAA